MTLSLIMKKKFIVRSLWVVIVILFVVSSCKQKDNHDDRHEDPYVLEIDSSLAVLLKPTNQEVVSSIPTVRSESGVALFSVEIPGRINYDSRNQVNLASRVSGRIERLYVKYNYQPIKKGKLIMEIYSPDLAAAQRELLLIAASDEGGDLLQRAKQRLLLLGMSSAQIDNVIKTGKVNYSVPVFSNSSGYLVEKTAISNVSNVMNSNGNSEGLSTNTSDILLREGQYVNAGQSLFSIYKSGSLLAEFSIQPQFAKYVKAGTSLLIQLKDSENVIKDKIGLIEPAFKNRESFSMARVYLKSSILHPGQLVKAHVPIMINEGWWLPKEAVWQSGVKSIVFKKENSVFVPENVRTGITINGRVQIMEDISSWEIASNAYYLVDSESFIRPQNIKEQE
jgi:hypothetical protein